MKLAGSRTEKNLLKAFAGESQARMRYTYFASAAKKEGFEQISAIFMETADNEKEHAKVFFKYLQGNMVEITATYPAGRIGRTKDNLLAAADGEKEEWGLLYPEFERIAREEGFKDIAASFKEISEVEQQHEKRYRKLFANILAKKVFKSDQPTKWKCRNCGYVHEGKDAPKKCPACQHPQRITSCWLRITEICHYFFLYSAHIYCVLDILLISPAGFLYINRILYRFMHVSSISDLCRPKSGYNDPMAAFVQGAHMVRIGQLCEGIGLLHEAKENFLSSITGRESDPPELYRCVEQCYLLMLSATFGSDLRRNLAILQERKTFHERYNVEQRIKGVRMPDGIIYNP